MPTPKSLLWIEWDIFWLRCMKFEQLCPRAHSDLGLKKKKHCRCQFDTVLGDLGLVTLYLSHVCLRVAPFLYKSLVQLLMQDAWHINKCVPWSSKPQQTLLITPKSWQNKQRHTWLKSQYVHLVYSSNNMTEPIPYNSCVDSNMIWLMMPDWRNRPDRFGHYL